MTHDTKAAEPALPPDALWHAKIVATDGPVLPPLPLATVLRSLSSERPAQPPYTVEGYTAAQMLAYGRQCAALSASTQALAASPAVERDALRQPIYAEELAREHGTVVCEHGSDSELEFSFRLHEVETLILDVLLRSRGAAIADQAPGEPT